MRGVSSMLDIWPHDGANGRNLDSPADPFAREPSLAEGSPKGPWLFRRIVGRSRVPLACASDPIPNLECAKTSELVKSSASNSHTNTLKRMLSTEQIALLDFEGSWWMDGGPKDPLIELRLGLSAAAYYDLLLALIDDPEAKAHDPLTVGRVQALIEPDVDPIAGVS